MRSSKLFAKLDLARNSNFYHSAQRHHDDEIGVCMTAAWRDLALLPGLRPRHEFFRAGSVWSNRTLASRVAAEGLLFKARVTTIFRRCKRLPRRTNDDWNVECLADLFRRWRSATASLGSSQDVHCAKNNGS